MKMPSVGQINVTFEELREIQKKCADCGNDLVQQINNIMNELDSLFREGWESQSGKTLAQEIETMALAHYDNYREALENYQRFIVDTHNRYAEEEETRSGQIRAKSLHQIT